MSAKPTYYKKSIGKTLIIIAGIIIAILMTMRGPIFKTTSQDLPEAPEAPTSQLDSKESSGSTSSTKYHSGTRLLEVFTKNLPYLNNK